MTRARVLAATAVLALGLGSLAACGGDDRLSEKEFRSQANELCEKAEEDTDALGEGLDENSTPADVEKSIDDLVARTEKLVDDLRALDEPESLTDDVESMLDAVSSAIEKVDEASVEELSSLEDPFTEANDKAKALELDSCSD